jgi:hypothetical protein
MSLKTWMEEFYPVEASETHEEEALSHSLQKWEGLRQASLDKHGCHLSSMGSVTDDEVHFLAIDASSCALCEHHYNEPTEDAYDYDGNPNFERCSTCPLALARGGVPCDAKNGSEENSPWGAWRHRGYNPEPMIHWLSLAAKEVVR